MAKILLIDDDPDIVESIKVVLESKGYEVACAANGKQGLHKAEKECFDLIILDIMMETADAGFEVCRALRKNQNYKDIPILLLTAIKKRTGFDFRKEAGDETWLPVDDYVDKPLEPDELLAKVEALLKKK